MALFRTGGGTGELKTVTLGSGAGTYDISEYVDKPHVCYAAISRVSASMQSGVYGASCSSSISVSESGTKLTVSGGSASENGSDGRKLSCSVSYSVCITYID